MYIKVLTGQVTLLGDGGYLDVDSKFDVPAFEIEKYPVTNAEYRRFVEDNGYNNLKYWTEDGWSFKKRENWKQPSYWDDIIFNQDNYPVVGVSWYEAIAYCNWLSEKTGDNITLPTEEQWQRAAQAMPDGSDSGYFYPWGNEWNHRKCNNSVNGNFSRATTIVDHYEKAGNVSPCGVVDMAGNTWEWCSTGWYTGSSTKDGSESRVIRGGSWINSCPSFLRSDARDGHHPSVRKNDYGFRCVRFS